jgi:hypothetical protein
MSWSSSRAGSSPIPASPPSLLRREPSGQPPLSPNCIPLSVLLLPLTFFLSYQSMVDTLVAIHTVDWRAVGLESFGKAGNFYPRNIRNLTLLSTSQEEISPSVPKVPFLRETGGLLLSLLPEDRISIIHGDYKFDNVVGGPHFVFFFTPFTAYPNRRSFTRPSPGSLGSLIGRWPP